MPPAEDADDVEHLVKARAEMARLVRLTNDPRVPASVQVRAAVAIGQLSLQMIDLALRRLRAVPVPTLAADEDPV